MWLRSCRISAKRCTTACRQTRHRRIQISRCTNRPLWKAESPKKNACFGNMFCRLTEPRSLRPSSWKRISAMQPTPQSEPLLWNSMTWICWQPEMPGIVCFIKLSKPCADFCFARYRKKTGTACRSFWISMVFDDLPCLFGTVRLVGYSPWNQRQWSFKDYSDSDCGWPAEFSLSELFGISE